MLGERCGLCRNDTNAEVNAMSRLSAHRFTAQVWCLLYKLKKGFYSLGSDVGTFALTSMMGVAKLRLTNNSAHLHHFSDCVGMFFRCETVLIIFWSWILPKCSPFSKSTSFLLCSWCLLRTSRECVFLAAWFAPTLRWPYSLARLSLDRKWLDSADQPFDSSAPVLRGVLNWRAPHMKTNNTDERKQSRAPYWNCVIVLGQPRWSCQRLLILYTRMHTALYLILMWNSWCASSPWP